MCLQPGQNAADAESIAVKAKTMGDHVQKIARRKAISGYLNEADALLFLQPIDAIAQQRGFTKAGGSCEDENAIGPLQCINNVGIGLCKSSMRKATIRARAHAERVI